MKRDRLGSLRTLSSATLFAGLLLAQDYTSLRERMVAEQLERRGVRNIAVLRAMRDTPRHLFVPPNLRSMAYQDMPLPIGYEATISQPYIVAVMTEALAPQKSWRVLEIGTGSGYQAAILSQLVAEVDSIEIVPQLAESAARTLRTLGYKNVSVRQGDGYKGWPERAPFDAIILTAAPPEIPTALVDQLANGGRLIAPEGGPGNQELVLINKNKDGKLQRRSLGRVGFVPMRPEAK